MFFWEGVALASVGLIWGAAYFRRFTPIGAAYIAKTVCTGVFGCGRDAEEVRLLDASAGGHPVLKSFRVEVDPAAREVSASWLGLFRRKAVFRPGLGAAIVLGGRRPPASPDPGPRPSRRDLPRAGPREALERALDKAFSERIPSRPCRTRAVLVVYEGRVVAERYAPGFGPETPLAGWSMSKSVMSAVVGILCGRGKLSPKMVGLLPEWDSPGDPRRSISLDDLLRMRSGLKFDEGYSNPLGDVERMLFASPDAGAFAASKPLAAGPGTKWYYSSGTTNIVSRIVRGACSSHEEYLLLPGTALFDRLGMRGAVLETDASGHFVGSSFMYATAEEWARFGLLYAQDGVWEGGRILPEGWVSYSTTPTPQSNDRYGAHWWLKLHKELGGESPAAARIPPDAFFALGHEGQTLSVVPSRKLVAVRLGLCARSDAWDQASFLDEVLTALEGRSK